MAIYGHLLSGNDGHRIKKKKRREIVCDGNRSTELYSLSWSAAAVAHRSMTIFLIFFIVLPIIIEYNWEFFTFGPLEYQLEN